MARANARFQRLQLASWCELAAEARIRLLCAEDITRDARPAILPAKSAQSGSRTSLRDTCDRMDLYYNALSITFCRQIISSTMCRTSSGGMPRSRSARIESAS